MNAAQDWRVEEALARSKPTWRQLRRIGAFLKPYRGALLGALLLELVGSVSYLLGPHLVQIAVDEGLAPGGGTVLVTVCGLFAVNVLLRALLEGRQLRVLTRTGQGFLGDLRRALFDHVQRLSMRFFDRTQHGRIISRVDRDVDAVERAVTWGPLTLISAVSLLGLGIASMARYDWRLCLAVTACIPTLAIASEIFRAVGMRAYRRSREAFSAVTAHYAETINGIRVIQASVQEDRNREIGRDRIERYRDRMTRTIRIWSTYMPTISMHYGVASAGILLYGGSLVVRGELSVGGLIAFLMLIEFVFHPIEELGELYNEILAASAAGERLFQVLDTEPEIVDRPGALDLERVEGRIAFRDVRFRYAPDLPWVLHGVSLSVSPGETAALVGETGAGKSSIVGLLCRFYEAEEGEVSIDGHDVRGLTLATLRRHVAVIPQDGYLFSGTVMENLRFGQPEADDDAIAAAARTLGVDAVLRALPAGYETPVGERGGNLSHGQRQMVCYVRALLAGPAVLILDEATSALDAATESVLQEALQRLARGRTTIVVAHRLSTIRHADRIFVVDAGRIVESGTHTELIAAGGEYARLYSGGSIFAPRPAPALVTEEMEEEGEDDVV